MHLYINHLQISHLLILILQINQKNNQKNNQKKNNNQHNNNQQAKTLIYKQIKKCMMLTIYLHKAVVIKTYSVEPLMNCLIKYVMVEETLYKIYVKSVKLLNKIGIK